MISSTPTLQSSVPLRLWQRLVQTALLVSAVMLLVPLTSNALPMLYKDGLLPFKPRDYKLFFTVLTLLLVIVNRPSLCIPALTLLVVPTARFLDAAVLQRFETEGFFEDHETYVLNL